MTAEELSDVFDRLHAHSNSRKMQLMPLRNSTTPNFSDGRRRRRTSNVRLPLKLSSDQRETSVTRVSEDLQLSIFRRPPKNRQIFRIEKSVFHQFGEVLEDLQPNGRQNQLPRQILLQIDLF